jgi:arginine/ornithine transport system permease protein
MLDAVIDFAAIQERLPDYGRGALVTLALLVGSSVAGFLVALPMAAARTSANPFLARPAFLFTYTVRGTPLLVQLFMIYYGLSQFDAVRASPFWPLLREAWFCAWLGLTINTAAYTTEIIAGALRATPAGEIEAARSLGLRERDIYWRILLPAALRRALPQYGNEALMLLHATSLASAVTLTEITRVARDFYANALLPLEAFATAALFYAALALVLVSSFRWLERRMLRHLRPMTTP